MGRSSTNSSVGNEAHPGPRILVIGYGNPGRQDDGIGPMLAQRLEKAGLAGVSVDADYQLNIEDAAVMAEHDIVLFVDASIEAPDPCSLKRVRPSQEIAFTSHSVSAESVLAICEDHFGAAPEAWILAVRGYEFEMLEGLTPQAQNNSEEAFGFIQKLIRVWKENGMVTDDIRKKTILAIDDDPDIRAALRIVLEAEGFSVGEAANAEEGLKVAERIQPDAIIVDLMMEDVDSGTVVAKTLKEKGYAGPIYMLSSAGDTVRYNLDSRELGLAGIFQKPIEPKMLVSTLNTKLKH